MHSFIVAGLFVLMVLAPCVFAQCYGISPVRVKLRWVRPPARLSVQVKPAVASPQATLKPNPVSSASALQTGIKLTPIRRVPESDFYPACVTQPDPPAQESLLE